MKRLLLGCLLALGACDIFGLDEDDVADQLREQRRAWVNQGIDDYSYEIAEFCFCPPPDTMVVTVHNNVVTSVVSKHGGSQQTSRFNRTMTQLYDYLIGVAEDSDETSVTFDTRLHIPTAVEVDRIENAVDDEFALWIDNFFSFR